MKKGIVIAMMITAAALPAFANDNGTVGVMIREKLEKVLSLLRDKELSKAERNGKILEVVNDAFDFPLMAKLSLGRKHWPRLKKEERGRYIALFTKHLQLSYLDKLDLYTDEELVFKPPRHVKNKIYILTEMVSPDNRIGILYKLHHSKKRGWLIYDVEVEGVSMITNYRTQFNEILHKGTVTDLFRELKKVNG